jgi:hypothetical protein
MFFRYVGGGRGEIENRAFPCLVSPPPLRPGFLLLLFNNISNISWRAYWDIEYRDYFQSTLFASHRSQLPFLCSPEPGLLKQGKKVIGKDGPCMQINVTRLLGSISNQRPVTHIHMTCLIIDNREWSKGCSQ